MLENKIIVITGASSGVGREIAIECAAKGAIVLLLARRLDKLVAVEKKIEQNGLGKSRSFAVDVSDMKQVERVFAEIVVQFHRIDVLINCAGFGKFEPLTEADLDEARKMFSVNVIGLMACTKSVLPVMFRQEAGQIVNIASIAGKIATPKSTVYSATKHAVLGFTNALRMEVEDRGITVTAVNPGPIQTAFFAKADPEGSYLSHVEKFMLQPGYVAQRTVQAIEKRKREVNLPWYMGLGAKLYQLSPSLFEKAGSHWLKMK
ncbi:SDR family oxidoreductase [Sporolactobacillus sp. THM7-4]|nr:SDR family oxidoreductase [Sporolactobacillus sp. THM7-4]